MMTDELILNYEKVILGWESLKMVDFGCFDHMIFMFTFQMNAVDSCI